MPTVTTALGRRQQDMKDDTERLAKSGASPPLCIKYMVCAWLSPVNVQIGHYKKWGRFKYSGEICKKSSITACYHNHDFEFIRKT